LQILFLLAVTPIMHNFWDIKAVSELDALS
jgi:hypothetical protein